MRNRAALLLLFVGGWAGVCGGQEAVPKYPLRLHVLAVDDTHRTVRLQPNWCGGSMPDGEESSCSSSGSASLGGGEDDFSGGGRADLVTPPSGTAGLSFTYEGCSRVRVPPGFQGLEARWIKPGSKLEVLIPTDAVTDGSLRTQRCSFRVVTHELVYLRLRTGGLVSVTQEAYAKKPALRQFLSGGSQKLERRGRVLTGGDGAGSGAPSLGAK